MKENLVLKLDDKSGGGRKPNFVGSLSATGRILISYRPRAFALKFFRREISMLLNFRRPSYWVVGFAGLGLLIAGCSQAATQQDSDLGGNGPRNFEKDGELTGNAISSTGEKYSDYNIVTLLPRDAIPAIDNPSFITVEEAEGSYSDDELVLGVEFNGDARAYSTPLLSSHEIVNDTVGGVKIAVTW
jgi:hypothetical protein